MALAFIISLERDLGDASIAYAKSKTGKALARETDRIDSAARRCRVTSLTGLLSESQSALIEQMKAEGFDPSKMRLPPEQWFPAADGLAMARALIAHITANLNDFKQPNPILRDLKSAETLLIAADGAGVRFHLTKTDF